MPSYQKKKKEKHEQKTVMAAKPTRSEKSVDVSDTLVDTCLISVFGVASTDKKVVKSREKASSRKKSMKKHLSAKKLSVDAKLEAMDQKWSKHFSHLEAFFLSKSLKKPSLALLSRH